MRTSEKRGRAMRVVCVIVAAFVCAIGVAQAAHAHQDSSTTSHHVCSICSTAHAGLSTNIAFAPPVLAASALVVLAPLCAGVLRGTEVHFIRPPPGF
ncbi:MAG: hypothetical protein ACRD3Q_00190 [Terriglobales bacterium]